MPEDSRGGERGSGLSVIEVLNVVLRKRRQVAVCGILIATVLGVNALLQPRTFTSHSSFMPEADTEASSVARMAQEVGLGVPSGRGEQPLAFYSDLLRSRAITIKAIDSTFVVPEDEHEDGQRREGNWAAIFDIEADDEARRRQAAIESLQGRVSVDTDYQTRTIRFSVTTPWPTVSRDAAALLLDLVNEFNLTQRQGRASERREFIASRLAESREELRSAEEALETFLDQNRQFEQSPRLVFEADRLEREVSFRQHVLTTLTQSYEEARIDEVRSTPVITPVVQPYVPPRPDGRGVVLRVVLGLMAGLSLGALLALIVEFFRRVSLTQDEDAAEFVRLRDEMRAEMRNPLRFFLPSGGAREPTPVNGQPSDTPADVKPQYRERGASNTER